MEISLRVATHPKIYGLYQIHVMDQDGNMWSRTFDNESLAFETFVNAVLLAQEGAVKLKIEEEVP